MLNTILFDLDGTLLPMDMDHFMKLYFYNMGVYFKGWIDPKQLEKNVLKATEVMIKTNDGRTNEEIFMEYFAGLIDGDIEEYKAHFAKYYETLFENVIDSTHKSDEMIEAVLLLKKKGYNLVVATNPLFPYRANIHRLEWAGMNPEWFSYISSFEDNSYSKLFTGFYEEVLNKIQKQPEECMMVGNDVFYDLNSAKLGIETYLITDYMINEQNLEISADNQGTYKEFLSYAKELPDLKK